MLDEHDEEIVFETKTSNKSFQSGDRDSDGDDGVGPFKMESAGDLEGDGKGRPESSRTLASDNSSIPPPPPGAPMEKSLSGFPPPGPPPTRELSEKSIPAPPPGPPPSNQEEGVRFDSESSKERKVGDSGGDRKANLLARVRSHGKGKGITNDATFFEDFDLRTDPLKSALQSMQVPKIDDPTLLGNKFARELPFHGDLSTGEGGERDSERAAKDEGRGSCRSKLVPNSVHRRGKRSHKAGRGRGEDLERRVHEPDAAGVP